jgi:2-hydroxy-3-keto-5-methylthiopentenyl-1-phosphate phosphatase
MKNGFGLPSVVETNSQALTSAAEFFVAIDFDGTVTDVDLLDAILKSFADPRWRDAEALWERGLMGSRKCLEIQMSLVREPLDGILNFLDDFTVGEDFVRFVSFLRRRHIPFAVISDGFEEFIRRILSNAGMAKMPVYANSLKRDNGTYRSLFPYAYPDCPSATCKCRVADDLSKGLPVLLIGDGRSDFCLARKSSFAFTKNSLTEYCRSNAISHVPFSDFREIEEQLKHAGVRLRK